MLGLMFYFVIISLYYVYIFSAKLNERLLRESELKALVKEAELRSLKFQLNPHFIFNSLNSLNSLTLSDPERASEMTVKLGDYLRTTLSRTDKQKSTLGEELDSARLYIDIEKVRFGDKIDYREDIGSNCLDLAVPSMIIQPLLENAIKHGVYESLAKVTIKVTARKNGRFLKLNVENNFDPEAVPREGDGIGLRNVRERLEKMYNRFNLVDIENSGDSFSVKLMIPLEEN